MFVGLFIVGLALPYYLRKRGARLRVPPPNLFTRWTPGQRAAFVWSALALTVLIVIPACITAAMLLVGFGECIDSAAPNSWLCTATGRAAAAVVAIAVFLPVVIKWTEFLSRVRNYRNDEPE
jgi:hypothetical protein